MFFQKSSSWLDPISDVFSFFICFLHFILFSSDLAGISSCVSSGHFCYSSCISLLSASSSSKLALSYLRLHSRRHVILALVLLAPQLLHHLLTLGRGFDSFLLSPPPHPPTHSDLSCWPCRSAPNFSASQIVDLWRVHDARLQSLLYLFWTDGQNNVRRSWEWLSAGSKSVWCKWPLMHYYFFFLPEPWIWCQSSSSSFCPTTLTLCRCCFFFSAAAAPLFPPFLFFYVHFVQMSLHFIYIYSVNLPVPDGGSAHACTALVLHKLGNVDKAARHTEPCLSSCNYQFFCRCNDWELVHR